MLIHETSSFPTLVTSRLILRQLKDNDAVAISILRSDERVNRYIDRANNASLEDARAFVEKMNKGFALYWAVTLKTDNLLIGTTCMWNFSEDKLTAEVGYELLPDFQGKGIMNEAVAAVLDYGFNKFGLNSIEAYVHAENAPSVNLLLKNGFKKTRKMAEPMEDGKPHNLVIYCLDKP